MWLAIMMFGCNETVDGGLVQDVPAATPVEAEVDAPRMAPNLRPDPSTFDAFDLRLPESLGGGGEFVGVTVLDGEIWVAERDLGLFRMRSNGSLEWRVSSAHFAPFGESTATDLVALPNGNLAVIVPGIGLEVNPDTGETSLYFCYEPEGGGLPDEPEPTFEVADAVGYDASTGLLVAQPVIYSAWSGERVGSAVYWFDLEGGQPVATLGLPFDVDTRAMVALDGEVLLAQDGWLETVEGERRVDLTDSKIDEVEGIALDDGDLWILGTNRVERIHLD